MAGSAMGTKGVAQQVLWRLLIPTHTSGWIHKPTGRDRQDGKEKGKKGTKQKQKKKVEARLPPCHVRDRGKRLAAIMKPFNYRVRSTVRLVGTNKTLGSALLASAVGR